MDLNLTPNFAQKLFEGEGGCYSTWSNSVLAETKVGAGYLVLHPRGFAFPHYADSSKVSYVLQGSEGLVGMVLPNTSKEVVLKLKKGDVTPVPLGAVSWWYNNGDSDLSIILLGETSRSHIPGQLSYFIFSGKQSIMSAFSAEFISKAYNMTPTEVDKLVNSQHGFMIFKVEPGIVMPQPDLDDHNMICNIDDDKQVNDVVKLLETGSDFPCLNDVGLSVEYVKLKGNAMNGPTYTADGSVKIIYIMKGSGRIQVVGLNGKRMLDTKIEAGQLVVVPKLFVVATIADDDGFESFSALTSTRPAIVELAGTDSIWNVVSPVVSQVALDIPSELEQMFMSKTSNGTNHAPRN